MHKLLAVTLCIAGLCGQLAAQGILEPHTYMEHGTIEHHAGSATVRADYARPLQQAITAVREEYGWAVSYEDPPYRGGHDLMDMTNPKYRAAHPNAPVELGPSGGAFQSTFPETPRMWSSATAEFNVLQKIVSDYNESGNPGNFEARELADGSFDVVGDSVHDERGEDVPVKPPLDTPISIPSAERSGFGTINAVLRAVSAKLGMPVGIAIAPAPLLGQARLTAGGSSVAARDLLMQVMDHLGRQCVWLLIYEPQPREYLLAIEPVTRAVYGAFGQKRLVPVGRVPGGL